MHLLHAVLLLTFLSSVHATKIGYGDVIYLQMQWADRFLSGSRSSKNRSLETIYNDPVREKASLHSTYHWKIRSDITAYRNHPDTKEGECLRYGDHIHLQNMWRDHRYLSTGIGDYAATTWGNNYTFKWLVLPSSKGGNNIFDWANSPNHGECVRYGEKIYLHLSADHAVWLTGGRSNGKKVYAIPYHSPQDDRYAWYPRPLPGRGGKSCDVTFSRGRWVNTGFTNGLLTTKREKGVTHHSEHTSSKTTEWETSVKASVSAGFKFGSASLEVETKFGETQTDSVENALENTELTEFTVDFDKPGVLWQFIYDIEDTCFDKSTLNTDFTILTDNVEEPPCCLPSYFHDVTNAPHGKCIDDSPCDCAPHVCDGKDLDESNVEKQEDEEDGSYIKYGEFVYIQNGHQNYRDKYLTGGRGKDVDKVFTFDSSEQSQEFTKKGHYEWMFRSVIADNDRYAPDPKQGSCVRYGDEVFIQVKGDRDDLYLGDSGASFPHSTYTNKKPTTISPREREFTYRHHHSIPELCAPNGGSTVFRGRSCGADHDKILWVSMKTNGGPHCSWIRDGGQGPAWQKAWVGYCGERPTNVPGLPTHVKDLPQAPTRVFVWTIRSNRGTGGIDGNGSHNDPKFGECVVDSGEDIAFIQNMGSESLWLNGARHTNQQRAALSDALFGSESSGSHENYYHWHIRSRYVHPDTEVVACAATGVIGQWVPTAESNGDITISREVGISRTSGSSSEQTKHWSLSVTAAFEADLKFGSAGLSVTNTYAESQHTSFSQALTHSQVEGFESTFEDGGIVWQFQYNVRDTCVDWDLKTYTLVATKSRNEMPCCLPGYFQDPNNIHGPCIGDSPCVCGDICDGKPKEEGECDCQIAKESTYDAFQFVCESVWDNTGKCIGEMR